MASTTESSFGAKLRRAQDLLTYIQGFTGYAPPRTQESATGFQTLLTSIIASNTSEINAQQQYKVAVDARQAAFKTNPVSITKLLPQIKGAAEAQYGKKSTEASAINAIIKTMRASKLIISPAAPSTDPNNPTVEQTLSQSEKSYGSQTQYFNDLINTISQFTGYAPSNNNIKLPQLQTFSTSITTLNTAVAQKLQPLKTARATRTASYKDLKDRVQRIKQYVKAQFGTNSNEYKLIKGISI